MNKYEPLIKLMRLFLWVFIATAVIVITTIAILRPALDRGLRAECQTWQEQAEELQDYYITKWQDEQCRDVGYDIDAPVR